MCCLYCYGTEGLWAFQVISLSNFILSVCIIFILSGQDANNNNNSSSSTLIKTIRYTPGITLVNTEHSIFCFEIILHSRVSLVAQLVNNPPAMWETLKKGKATHFSILAWKIPWALQPMGSQRVGPCWATFTFTPF